MAARTDSRPITAAGSSARAHRHLVTLFAFTIFLSAFLLFQVQLIMGKYILPWFGGTPSVWTTCLLFFQVLLLAGYAYAHWMSSRLSPVAQIRLHRGLLLVAVLALAALAFLWRAPILPGSDWRPQSPDRPVWHILRLLASSVGLPFFLLATTGPLLQRWFSHACPGPSPYRLYALSNLGSLLGLLTYPFLFEPALTLRAQASLWSFSFVVFAVACGACAWVLGRAATGTPVTPAGGGAPAPASSEASPRPAEYVLWLVLPGCASVMLLATTNLICQEVAVIPFLWVLPLSLYLLSFIICFDSENRYRRAVFHPLLGISAVVAALVLFRGAEAGLMTQINTYSVALFACCMVCHGELVRLKPGPRHLTAFYLMMAAGGAVGGIFVALIAPRVFPAFWEFQLGLWGSCLLLVMVVMRDRDSWFYVSQSWLPLLMILLLALVPHYAAFTLNPNLSDQLRRVHYYPLVAALAAVTLLAFWRSRGRPSKRARFRAVQLVAVSMLVLLGWLLVRQARWQFEGALARSRNFYGVLTVLEEDKGSPEYHLTLRHGKITHGMQYQDPELRRLPTAYFSPTSGIGVLLAGHPRASLTSRANLRLGIVGLGVGTLAAYGRSGDYIRFYEINSEVLRYAAGRQSYFTFLRDSPATIDIVLGDGRLSLERELQQGQPQQFDVLVLDAFNSDSVPVHLLTREAFEIYLRHLRGPESILAFHISNRALDLRPVLVRLAQEFRLQLVRVRIERPGDVGSQSDWVMLSESGSPLAVPAIAQFGRKIEILGEPPLWTDEYSNLLQVLKR